MARGGIGIELRSQQTCLIWTGDLLWISCCLIVYWNRPIAAHARNRSSALIGRSRSVSAKVALRLRDGGHAGCEGTAPDFLVPLLVPPEEELVFHDWPARVISVVVASQLGLPCLVLLGEVVIRIECVITALIKKSAMNLVFARFRRKADDGAGCLAMFC